MIWPVSMELQMHQRPVPEPTQFNDGTREYKGYSYRVVKSMYKDMDNRGKIYYCIHEPEKKWFGFKTSWNEWCHRKLEFIGINAINRRIPMHYDTPEAAETAFLGELDKRYTVSTFNDEVVK